MADNDNDLMPRPRQRQRAPFDLAFGDSIAVQQYNHGVAGTADDQFRGDSTQVMKPGATAGVGDPPSRVLTRLKQTLEEHPDFFKGKRVFLSPGTSNNPAQLADVKQIFDTLNGLGDNAPASVVVPGVGPGVRNSEAVNAALGKMVGTAGYKYYDPQGLRWQGDGVHPANGAEMQAGAAQAIEAPAAEPVVAAPVSNQLAPQPTVTLAPQRVQVASAGGSDTVNAAADQRAQDLALLNKTIYQRETSSGRNVHVSTAGAIGPMQIMPGTWTQYAQAGENINNYADNMRVGQRIVADLYDRYGGNPDAVLIGYNAGERHIGQQFATLRPETQNYIIKSHQDWEAERPDWAQPYTPYTGQTAAFDATRLAAGVAPSPYTAAPEGSGFASGLPPVSPSVTPTPYAAAPEGSGMGTGLAADPNVNIARFADPAGYADVNPLYGSPLRMGGALGNVVQGQQWADTQPGGLTALPYPGTLGTSGAGVVNEAGGPPGAPAGQSQPPGQMTARQMFALGLAQGFRGVPVTYDPWASLQRFPQERGRPSSYLGGLTPVTDPRIPVPSVSYSPVSNPFFSVIRQPGRSGTGSEIAAQGASYGGGG